ncbi:hypothetical protein [Helicobacter bizzozeronii]|uniref:hypothetical protein n=1 Tax=Helicobacter bizzozeronii TaxID=56877 RepID=UPI000CEE8EDD|nr:hypothetical protein [Helicobacter bizzozeronii]
MPVSIVGNVTYVNQNAPYSSIVNQNALPKIEEINQKEFVERLQVVQATRALEKNQAVHRDKEEQKNNHPQQESSPDQPDARCRQDKAHCYHGHYYSDRDLERAVENTHELEQFVEKHVFDITI